MRTLASVTCTIVAAGLVAACSAAGAAPTTAPGAQSAAPAPGAATPQPTTQVITAPPSTRPMTDGAGDEVVTGIVIDVTQSIMETSTKVAGHEEVRGGQVVGTHDATDARVSGRTILDFSVDWYTTGGVFWGTQTIKNDTGSWTGPCSGMSSQRGSFGPFTCWLEGQGGYDGWTYYVVSPSSGSRTPETVGYIFEGTPPAR